MAAIHTEEQFEDEICEVLKAQGWLVDGPLPFQKGFAYDKGYDRRAALYPEDAIAWVKDTQLDAWEKFAKNHTKNPEAVFIERLVQELDKDRPTIKKETPQLWGFPLRAAKGLQGHQRHFQDGAVCAQQPAEPHHLGALQEEPPARGAAVALLAAQPVVH